MDYNADPPASKSGGMLQAWSYTACSISLAATQLTVRIVRTHETLTSSSPDAPRGE
jgi:hypothetical protein